MKAKHIAWFIALVFILFLIIGLSACRSVSKIRSSSHTDSLVSISRDTVYHNYDSAGHTYTKETIKEYRHDSTIFQPILTREIIREAGQIVYVHADSGKASQRDTVIVVSDNNSSNEEKEGLKVPVWFWLGLMAILALFIFKRKA